MARREERAVVISVDEGAEGEELLVLEGLFIAAETGVPGGVVIAPPHPAYGGSMETAVVSELAWAVTRAGLASLRFNWRGVGASRGVATGDLAVAVTDYRAAIDQLAATVSGPLVACGYSFGAVAALAAAGDASRVDRCVLVAPPPALLSGASPPAVTRRTLVAVGARDPIAPLRELAAWTEGLPAADCIAIPEADHFFGVGLRELGGEVADWLARSGDGDRDAVEPEGV